MFAIELVFPTGRYHATPWGRNVNEAVPEWPPSPWRLARGLFDTWRRRLPEMPQDRVESVLKAISGPARFLLPPARAESLRYFYYVGKGKQRDNRQLVFDPFVAVGGPVVLGFSIDAAPEVLEDLSRLLEEMSFFGRAESPVRARLVELPEAWNCEPLDTPGLFLDRGQRVARVACLRPREDYLGLKQKPAIAFKVKGRGRRPEKRPASWLEAIAMTTEELRTWTSPPAMCPVDYPEPPMQEFPASKPRGSPSYRLARYALHARPLPVIEDTLSVAETVRRYLMGIHARITGDRSQVSRFTGRDHLGNVLRDGHRHAHFWPIDRDGDGRIDQLVVMSPEPWSDVELQALNRLVSMRWNHEREIRLVPLYLSEEAGTEKAEQWVSATPVVITRHYRRGRGPFQAWLESEIRRECTLRGLPEPSRVSWTLCAPGARPTGWLRFRCARKDDPMPRRFGFRLEFDRPVSGPFALGALSHFGIGLFVPANPERAEKCAGFAE